jgi:hypothetical protein
MLYDECYCFTLSSGLQPTAYGYRGALGRRPSHRKRRTNNDIIYAVIILYYVLAYSPYGYRGALGRRARPKAEP